MMFPAKLLVWLGNDPKRGLALSAMPGGGWFATMHVLGKAETVAEGSDKTPGEAIIRCWENYLVVSN